MSVDTTALDGDEPSRLARELYEASPFTVGRPWDDLSPAERQPWHRRALEAWLRPPTRR